MAHDRLAYAVRGLAQQRVDERLHLDVGKRLQGDAVHLAGGRERGVPLEQLGARRRDEQERDVGDVRGDVLDEGEQRVVGPVQVLDHEDGGVARGDVLEEAQPGGEVLVAVGRGCLEPEQGAQALAEPLAVLALGQDVLELRLDGRSPSSFSRMPACALTISARAQKVTPSP